MVLRHRTVFTGFHTGSVDQLRRAFSGNIPFICILGLRCNLVIKFVTGEYLSAYVLIYLSRSPPPTSDNYIPLIYACVTLCPADGKHHVSPNRPICHPPRLDGAHHRRQRLHRIQHRRPVPKIRLQSTRHNPQPRKERLDQHLIQQNPRPRQF